MKRVGVLRWLGRSLGFRSVFWWDASVDVIVVYVNLTNVGEVCGPHE